MLGLAVLRALYSRGLLRGRSSHGALVDVRVAPDQVHCALDICKHLHLLAEKNQKKQINHYTLLAVRNKCGCELSKRQSKSPTCWSLHTELTLLRLLLLMATGCPIGGNELTPLEPPAMETVMLMLL